VYTMRFDESSARYALFGPFYFGYILSPAELLETVRLTNSEDDAKKLGF